MSVVSFVLEWLGLATIAVLAVMGVGYLRRPSGSTRPARTEPRPLLRYVAAQPIPAGAVFRVDDHGRAWPLHGPAEGLTQPHDWEKTTNDLVMWVCTRCRAAVPGREPGFTRPDGGTCDELRQSMTPRPFLCGTCGTRDPHAHVTCNHPLCCDGRSA